MSVHVGPSKPLPTSHFPAIKQVLNGNNTAWSTLDIVHKVMMVACYIHHLFSFGMMTDSSVQWIPVRIRREPVCFGVCKSAKL